MPTIPHPVIPGLVVPRIHALTRHKVHPCTEPGIHFLFLAYLSTKTNGSRVKPGMTAVNS